MQCDGRENEVEVSDWPHRIQVPMSKTADRADVFLSRAPEELTTPADDDGNRDRPTPEAGTA